MYIYIYIYKYVYIVDLHRIRVERWQNWRCKDDSLSDTFAGNKRVRCCEIRGSCIASAPRFTMLLMLLESHGCWVWETLPRMLQGCFLKKKLQAFLENMGGASTVSSPPASTRERLQSKELLLSTLCLRAWSRSSRLKLWKAWETLGMGGPLIINPIYTLYDVGIYSGPYLPSNREVKQLGYQPKGTNKWWCLCEPRETKTRGPGYLNHEILVV